MAYAVAATLRRQSAAMRHAVWTAGLIGALIIPFCSLTLPSWQNPLLGNAEHFFESFVSAKQVQSSSGQSNDVGSTPSTGISSNTASMSAQESRPSTPV